LDPFEYESPITFSLSAKKKYLTTAWCSIPNVKFCVNVFQMRPDGETSDIKAFSNLCVGQTLSDQDKDFSLILIFEQRSPHP
jgi:hypothetical protein